MKLKMVPKKNKTTFPLFWKFTVLLVLVVLIFSLANIVLLWTTVYKSFESEINKRSTVLAKIVAEKAITPLVYEDNLSLYRILDEVKQTDPTIAYIFILNNFNHVVAKTYDTDINDELIKVNSLNKNNLNIEVIKATHYKYKVVRDIAYPILNGEVGVVRIGIVEEQIQHDLWQITNYLILMISIFLIVGLLGALFFSYVITSPIKKISNTAQSFNLEKIEEENHELSLSKKWYQLPVSDELDVLVSKFTEMIDRLKNSHRELKETQNALIQAEKLAALGTLSAGIAHEINNPISGIKNCVKRIEKYPRNTTRNIEYLELIKEASNKIENVVHLLLNFSRKEPIAFMVLSINEVISNAISLTKHKMETKQVELISRITDFNIKGSMNHLDQVFVTLIINSLDSIEEKKAVDTHHQGEIIILTEIKHDKGIIRVSDNGAGIPKSIQKHIFDPFFTSKPVGKGTGLGLSISYNLIKEHQGNISFKTKEGKGTEFIIELPLHKEETL